MYFARVVKDNPSENSLKMADVWEEFRVNRAWMITKTCYEKYTDKPKQAKYNTLPQHIRIV